MCSGGGHRPGDGEERRRRLLRLEDRDESCTPSRLQPSSNVRATTLAVRGPWCQARNSVRRGDRGPGRWCRWTVAGRGVGVGPAAGRRTRRASARRSGATAARGRATGAAEPIGPSSTAAPPSCMHVRPDQCRGQHDGHGERTEGHRVTGYLLDPGRTGGRRVTGCQGCTGFRGRSSAPRRTSVRPRPGDPMGQWSAPVPRPTGGLRRVRRRRPVRRVGVDRGGRSRAVGRDGGRAPSPDGQDRADRQRELHLRRGERGAGLVADQQVRRGPARQALLRRLRARRRRREPRARARAPPVPGRGPRQRPAPLGRAGQHGGLLLGAQAGRPDPGHEPRPRRAPHPRRRRSTSAAGCTRSTRTA